MSAKDALNRYYARLAKPKRSRQKRNQKPEFELSKEILSWLQSSGFVANKIEAKATYSESAGRYISGQVAPGFADIVGVTPHLGVACFIELKAPGKRSTLKPHQREFLIKRIDMGAFACVTDSVDHLSGLFRNWINLRRSSELSSSVELLRSDLPKSKDVASDSIELWAK